MESDFKKSAKSLLAIVLEVSLLLAIASFATPVLSAISGVSALNAGIFFINRLLIWLVLTLLCLYIEYVQKQNLLVWPESSRPITFYLASTVVILLAVFTGNLVLAKLGAAFTHNETSTKFLTLIKVLKTNIPLLVFTAFTAAVTEELIFRGFIQTRFEQIFKNPAWGILISSALFAVVHLSYGTLINFIVPFYIGIIFSLFYRKYQNIKVLIVCHFLWDLFGLIIAIKSD